MAEHSTDPQIPPDADAERVRRLQNRFDIRRIIGGLFSLYGAILVLTGIVGSDIVKNKADGINVNLWCGICLLVFGVAMFTWAVRRPVVPEPRATR
jgi:hypothetical protein